MINESYVAAAKHLSRAFLVTVVAFILMMCFFAVNAFAGVLKEYNIVINDNGYEYTIATDETQPLDILNSTGIKLGAKDKLNITAFKENVGGTIIIDRYNTIIIDFNGIIKTYGVYADTVGEAFAEVDVNIEDCLVNYESSAPVENGMVITVNSPNAVTVRADGKTHELGIVNGTVGDVLSELNIKLSGDDYLNYSKSTPVTDGMVIRVYRVEAKTVTEKQTIAYSVKQIEDGSLEKGKTKLETAGVNGEKTVTYEVVYVNGEVKEKKQISSTVTKEPVDEVKRVGTKVNVINTTSANNYKDYTVGQIISGKYTHYCACEVCCGKSNGVTASGKKVQNGMEDPYYIACNWLPLGSVIEVNGTTYTVVDRGGNLSRQGRIDIFTPEGHEAAVNYGTGSCTIKIVRLGW
ncbi:MAG: G5 domain-containing protein [Eubacterium sp.]|nr:G5 domain-containing protein [Eubacterium sp.]